MIYQVSSAPGLSGPVVFITFALFFLPGPLPKQLPVSLEVLDLSGGENETGYGGFDDRHKFTGGIPSEWGALTNLKELKMPNSGLDGKRSAPVLPLGVRT
jgi:hypothetical protein